MLLRNILPLEGTHTLILRGPEEGILLLQISEFGSAFQIQTEQSILTTNWTGPGVGLEDEEGC